MLCLSRKMPQDLSTVSYFIRFKLTQNPLKSTSGLECPLNIIHQGPENSIRGHCNDFCNRPLKACWHWSAGSITLTAWPLQFYDLPWASQKSTSKDNQSRKLHPGQHVQDRLQLGLCLASHLNTIISQLGNDTFCEHILKKLDFHISSKKTLSTRRHRAGHSNSVHAHSSAWS